MSAIFGNLIGGEWRTSQATTPNINPSNTSDIVGLYPDGSEEEAEAAVAAACSAFKGWSRSNPSDRGALLSRVAERILGRREELARLLAREEGKPLADALAEVVRAAQVFNYFSAEAVRIAGESIAGLHTNVVAQVTREPVGVVALITPWNFPIAIPAFKVAPALAYGNCVVLKPSELAPGCAVVLAEILVEAGCPPGVFNLVIGTGGAVGARLSEHDDVSAVSFTGSVHTGRKVAAAAICGTRMKKLQLELGGKNPLIVLDDADLENAVDCAIDGAFFSTGQRCTASSRLIVTDGVIAEFCSRLTDRLSTLVVDDALKPGTQIGPAVNDVQFERDLAYIRSGVDEGATLAYGGAPLRRDHEGYYLAPALFIDASSSMRISREEIFGPIAAVIRVKDYDEALQVANDTPFGLSAGICTTSLKYAEHFKRNSESGVVKVNLPTTGVDFHLPFGGRKTSSYGARELGTYASEFYTEVKTSYVLAR